MDGYRVGPETERMLDLGHPWIIADRYTKGWTKGASGDLVLLQNQAGKPLATALLDPGDRIVARVLARGQVKLSAHWFEEKFLAARALREHAQLTETDVYRLVNGEGDGLPGLTVDRYGDYLMLQLYTSAWDRYLELISSALVKVFTPRGIYRKLRPQETRALEAKANSKKYSRLCWGTAAPVPLIVQEHGISYLVDLSEGLNTGIFPDQRRNRLELMSRVADKRVLNLFAFTGAFSVAAAAAGAAAVTSVDVSAKYLGIAEDNFKLNKLASGRHRFIVADVFAELAKMKASGTRFDVILFDPPSFSTTRKSRFSTQGGTAKLVAATLPLLEPGGLLVSSSNHQKVSIEDYLKELRRGALQSHDELRTIFVGGQPEDFPCPVTFPEGRYLKFVINVKGL